MNPFFKNKLLILASGSPRRKELLEQLEIPFRIEKREVNEDYPKELHREEISDFLAQKKAEAFDFSEIKDNEILLTSDTIVWFRGKALGKPNDKKEAFQMLKNLSGKTHEVITSCCLKNNLKLITFHSITKVKFKELSNEEINFYIDNYTPFDKAGGYGVQEWIGMIGVEKLEGSYYNVVGLPTKILYSKLLNFIK